MKRARSSNHLIHYHGISLVGLYILILFLVTSCVAKKKDEQFAIELKSLDLNQGELALCGAANGQFGTVKFGLSCSEKVRGDFDLATALLHSFEYAEAEKMFAKVIDVEPSCVMAYWGAAMCNFHPLWEAPGENDLKKGSRIIQLGRSLIQNKSSRESDYLEAIATIYDDWDQIDHRTRVAKFANASEKIYLKYPEDSEAAIFYALALRTAADPTDKSFQNQKKAVEILNQIQTREPNHPGIAHYIIHAFDYPGLAEMALPAARKYARISATSAHALHMPSHIFTRLGLWGESIQSNSESISAAQCYVENSGKQGHWDEELHGLDYLLYAYLQQGNFEKAREQMEYLRTIKEVFPQNFKVAYCFAAMPTRYALERKAWTEATQLELIPLEFPWDKFPWEKANINFGRLLGAIHSHNLVMAEDELKNLQVIYEKLQQAKESYKANLVQIQIQISESWIQLREGNRTQALAIMSRAADLEDATEKHPVTPGEVLPARELLGDMFLEMSEPAKALQAYEANLRRHPNRFNGLYGAGLAAEKLNDIKKAKLYYEQLVAISESSDDTRPELSLVKSFLRKNR